MKLAMMLMLLAGSVKASPYFYVPFVTKDAQVNLSQGALFTPSQFNYSQTFTNMAIVYHPLSSGSIIPQTFQAYIPPESWSINFGGGYNAANGETLAGPGISINLLDSVRSEFSNLLNLSKNATLMAMGAQIAPGNGPLSINIGPQWAINMAQNGVVNPLNKWRLDPFWFIGASYSFGGPTPTPTPIPVGPPPTKL